MNDLLKEINEKISQYLMKRDQKFVPGETPILVGSAVYDDKEINAIVGSVLKGWFGLGTKGREFEKAFSERVGKKHSIYVNSGSSANFLALHGVKTKLGLEGGEVVTPASAFPTTVNPIIQLGFKPHFIDVDGTLNVKPEWVASAINENTKGIVFAHSLGNPAKVDEIKKIADENNLFLIEDCCDALGSKYRGKECGSWGDVATHSFYPAHIITTGEGGMVCTDDSAIKRIIVGLRDWGRDCWCSTDEKNVLGACGERFDHKVVDPALALLVAGVPILYCRILDLSMGLSHQFDHSCVQLVFIIRRGCTALQVGHITALFSHNQGAFELSRILGIDSEVGG